MKFYQENTPAVIILISGIMTSLVNFSEGDNHQRSVDYDNENSSEPSAKVEDFNEYANIDLKRLQPQVTVSQYDYYDYSNQDYPNYDHNRNNADYSRPSDPDEYEDRNFDSKRASGGFPMYGLEKSIPGTAGMDYPNYNTMPRTEFDCQDHPNAGLYGDIETGCQMFHICQEDGRHDTFLCPVGTIFNQQHFICDWWFNYNCSETPQLYPLNSKFYRNPATQGGNRKHKHHHSHSHGNHILQDMVKKMDNMMQDGKEMELLSSDDETFQEKADERTHKPSEDGNLASNQELSSKSDIWEPMRRYRRVKVKKISLNSDQDYDEPKRKYVVDRGSFLVPDVNNVNRKVERNDKQMTTINYAIQLLHQKLNSPPPPPSRMDSQPSSTSKIEYATASNLENNVESTKHLSDTFSDSDITTKSEDLIANVQNKPYLPTLALTSKLDDGFSFSTENYRYNTTITTTAATVSKTPTYNNNNDYLSLSIQQNGENIGPSVRDDNHASKPLLFSKTRNNQNHGLGNSVPNEKRVSEEPLLNFDYGRRIRLDRNQSAVGRKPLARRRNPIMRRPGTNRLRWRYRLMRKQRNEMKKPEIALALKNMTSFYKVKRYKKRKLSKPQPKVEWMLYPKNESTRGRSWNDFIRQRRTMLKAKRLIEDNKDIVPNDFLPSTPSILENDNYISTVGINISISENDYSSERVASYDVSNKLVNTNQSNYAINEEAKNQHIFNNTRGNHVYFNSTEKEENPIKSEEVNKEAPKNITGEKTQQINRKLSKIRVNRRCKAVCIRLIKNHLPNLDLEESEDGLYTLSTNNRNLQWLKTKRLPSISYATEYQPQAAESGSIISKDPDCDESTNDSFKGWSIIIDRGAVTKEKTIKRKCNLKRDPKNKNSLFHNGQLSRSSSAKYMHGQPPQNGAIQSLWPENFRRGVHVPVSYSRGEILVSSESEVSKQNDQRNTGYTVRSHDPRLYGSGFTKDKSSQKLPMIDWKQKELQSQILRASSLGLDPQSQQHGTDHEQTESYQHPFWDEELGKSSRLGWSKDHIEKGSEMFETRRMNLDILPFSKIIWPPGARGSKIDWSQNANDNFSNSSWVTKNKNTINILSNETNISSPSDSQPDTLFNSSSIDGALLSEFKVFLESLLANQTANEKQPALKHKSMTTGHLENKWNSKYTDSFKKGENLYFHNPYSTNIENVEDNLFSSPGLFSRNKLFGIQNSDERFLTSNQKERSLQSGSPSKLRIDELDDKIAEKDSPNDDQNFYVDFKLNPESYKESMLNFNAGDKMLNTRNFQTLLIANISSPKRSFSLGSRRPQTLENFYRNNYSSQKDQASNDVRSRESQRLQSQPTQIDWSVYKPINLTLNYNSSNDKTFNNKEVRNIWPRGIQHFQQKDWSSGIQSFVATMIPNNQKGYSGSTQNSIHDSNSPKQPTPDAQPLQKGRSNNRQILFPDTKGSSNDAFPTGTQTIPKNQPVNGQRNRNIWLTNEDGLQPKGDQNSMKGRLSGNARSLKDWLFDTENNQELPSSDTQEQNKGMSFQTENPKNQWSPDTPNFHKGTKDSNNRNVDEGKPDEGRYLGDNFPSRKNPENNKQPNIPTNNKWSSSVNRMQNKGQPVSVSTAPSNSWMPSGLGSQKGSQQDYSNPLNDQWPNNQHSENNWSFEGKNSQNDRLSKGQTRQGSLPSNGSGLDKGWPQNSPKDSLSSNTSINDWSSNVPNDDWSSNVPKDDWPSNSGQNTKGSLFASVSSGQNIKGSPFDSANSDDKKSSNSGSSKNDDPIDQRLSQADISKIIEELKLSLQNLKIPSRTPDTKDPDINWPSSDTGSNKGRMPRFPNEDPQNKGNGRTQPGNSKGNMNSRTPKNSTMKKKIRWSVQIDGNGKPKSGWIPITLRPLLDMPKNSKDNEGTTSKGDEDDEWSSWGDEPSFDDNESRRDNANIPEAIDSQGSEHKLLWVPPIDLNLQSSEKTSQNASQLPLFLQQPSTKQIWSAQFDGSTVPASGWLPIIIRNVSLTGNRNKTQAAISHIKSNVSRLEESRKLKIKPQPKLLSRKGPLNLTSPKIIVSTDVFHKIVEMNKIDSNHNQKHVIQNSLEKLSLLSSNTSNIGIITNTNQSKPSSNSATLVSSGDTINFSLKIAPTTTTPSIVSSELQMKFMQVGRNETLRILPFSLIHKQLNRTSKNAEDFKGSHFQSKVLKSTLSVQPDIFKFPLEHLLPPNATKNKELKFTTFTIADGRLRPSSSRTSGHFRPPVNREWFTPTNYSKIVQLSQTFSHKTTASPNRIATNVSIDNEQTEAIITGNVHKL